MGKSKGHLQQQAGAGATKDKTKGDQMQQQAGAGATRDKTKGDQMQQQAGAGATKDKTKGDQQQQADNVSSSAALRPHGEKSPKRIPARQQQADNVSSSAALPPQGEKSPKRKPPRDRRSSPGAGSPPKKNRKAPDTNPDELAAVEGLEETNPPTTTEPALPTIESAPPTTVAPLTVVNTSSAGASNSDTGNTLIELPGSSRSSRQRKGKDEAGVNSDSSDKGKDMAGDNSDDSGKSKGAAGDDSDASDSDIQPPPVKKPYGFDRLQRGRKIKASSPAGRNILIDLLIY